jgi:hypothetical protein
MLRRTILLLILSTLFLSCANTTVYVLNKDEVVRVKKTQTITSNYDGWLLSDRAVNRVMNTRIKAVNLE